MTFLPSQLAWRQAARMMFGSAVAYVATHALHLHTGYWAMITVMNVVQGNVGGTLDAGLTQLAGTVLGGVFGMAGVWLRAHHLLPEPIVLLLVLAPLALVAASSPHFRTGPLTALIVLLVTPSSGSGIDLALDRIGEIAIGSLIGIAVSILVLPGRARVALEVAAVAALRALADLAHGILAVGDTQGPRDAVKGAIERADMARTQWQRERAVRLASSSPVDPLLRALRRVRTDLFMLERAMDRGQGGPASLAVPLQGWLRAAAVALAAHAAPPAMDGVTQDAAVPADGVLSFCLDVLRRDLANLAARIAAFSVTTGSDG